MGPLSAPAAVPVRPGGPRRVTVEVGAGGDAGPLHRPWQPMVGSEHLSHLLSADRTGGRAIGADLCDALRRIRDELGVGIGTRARHPVRRPGRVAATGRPRFDFDGVDRVYDIVLELGMRPVVELSFMPRDLARDPHRTVFAYRGIISPPRDWDRWAELVRALIAHLVDRYGRDEVRDHWPFEVWNEANLSVFWSGTPAGVLAALRGDRPRGQGRRPRHQGRRPRLGRGRLDRRPAGLDRAGGLPVHPHLRQPAAGPAAAAPAAGCRCCGPSGASPPPTATRSTTPSSPRRSCCAACARRPGGWTRWRPWVASDHFEELGRPPRLLHGGFGLLTVGNLAKPKYLGAHARPAARRHADCRSRSPATARAAWSRLGGAAPTVRRRAGVERRPWTSRRPAATRSCTGRSPSTVHRAARPRTS